jgi:hypothetical protein
MNATAFFGDLKFRRVLVLSAFDFGPMVLTPMGSDTLNGF